MKKLIVIFAVLFAVCVSLCACTVSFSDNEDGADKFSAHIVFTCDEEDDGKTLLDVMTGAKEAGSEYITSFTVENGMITEINGIENADGVYWFLYTDDEEFSNTAWGEITYEGKTYASASKGASELIVKTGKTYIWEYKK